eukprot:scaffold676_cov273-Pinguiococcus_pyrenoidosus.AAC.4
MAPKLGWNLDGTRGSEEVSADTSGRMDGWTDGPREYIFPWMDGWTDGRMDGWTDGWYVWYGSSEVPVVSKAIGVKHSDK